MNTQHQSIDSPLRGINNGQASTCQAKSEDRIGDLLDLIVDGLVTKGASKEASEAGGAALIELARIQVNAHGDDRLRCQRDDIQLDLIAGTHKALANLSKRLGSPSGGGSSGASFARPTPSVGKPVATSMMTRKELKRYVMGIVKRQLKSAKRVAWRYVSRNMTVAWSKEGEDEQRPISLEAAATAAYLERLRQDGPTAHQVQTVIANAALQGRLFAAALYDLSLKVYEDHGEPAPEIRKAPATMSKRTRQRREQATKLEMKAELKKLMRDDRGDAPMM